MPTGYNDKAYQAAYREKNRERIRARNRAYKRALRERPLDPAKHKSLVAYHRAWQRANRVTISEQRRRKRVEHPERFREQWARYAARKRETEVGPVDYRQVLRDANGVCGICRMPLDLFGTEIDHIVPLARGGTHTADNLQAAHAFCNRSKGAKVA